MNFFKKKTMIYSPASGDLKLIERVNDELFSSKALGDGFAVEPKDNIIVSPVAGVVKSVFPTKHAISIETKEKLEVLLHIGIDTVELNGDGFKVNVKEGDKVNFDTKLAEVDFDFLQSKNKETDVIVVFTNLANKKLAVNESSVVSGARVGDIQ